MDAKKLEILMTAVDLGSFSKASEVVGYTQSGRPIWWTAWSGRLDFR